MESRASTPRSVCRGLVKSWHAPGTACWRRLSMPASARLPQLAALLLRPIGDGSLSHLGEAASTLSIRALGQAFLLQPGRYSVGRTESSHLSIPVPTVSSKHAVLETDGEDVVVTDLGSTNGTLCLSRGPAQVNGVELEALQPTELPLGSVIVFGDQHLAQYVLEHENEQLNELLYGSLEPAAAGGSESERLSEAAGETLDEADAVWGTAQYGGDPTYRTGESGEKPNQSVGNQAQVPTPTPPSAGDGGSASAPALSTDAHPEPLAYTAAPMAERNVPGTSAPAHGDSVSDAAS
ncbi:hypothetical protein QJQ45_013759 [Haematococcus lacustris]|nr:hypothetical protein QJQ45_013759 [Haematococcus lacustris]